MDHLFSIQGEELNAVCFVMDYVEFHFNGMVLRALNMPVLEVQGETVSFPNAGSRDALCGLIGETVVAVQIQESKAIQVSFTNQKVLRISLQIIAGGGPEAAHFVAGRNLPIEVY